MNAGTAMRVKVRQLSPAPTSSFVVSGKVAPWAVRRPQKFAENASTADRVILFVDAFASKQTEGATMPTVDVPTVIKTTSALAFLVCAFSFVLWLTTGFQLIYPSISVLIAAFAVVFYIMGEGLRRQWTKR